MMVVKYVSFGVFLLMIVSCEAPNNTQQETTESKDTTAVVDPIQKELVQRPEVTPPLSEAIAIKNKQTVQEQDKQILEWWFSVRDLYSQDDRIAITRTGTYKIILYTKAPMNEEEDQRKALKELQQILIDAIPFAEQFPNLFEQREHPTLEMKPSMVYLGFEADIEKARAT